VAKVIAGARARGAALGLYLWLVVVTSVRRGGLCGLQIRDVDLDRARWPASVGSYGMLDLVPCA